MTDQELFDQMRAAEARSVGLPAWPASRGAQTIADRVRAKLTQARVVEPDMPITVSFVDPWRQDVFLILARRCGLDPQQLAPDDGIAGGRCRLTAPACDGGLACSGLPLAAASRCR